MPWYQASMFRFLLRTPYAEPNDPAAFITAVPNWELDETFTTGDGSKWQILAIETDIDEEFVGHGFAGIFTIEAV